MLISTEPGVVSEIWLIFGFWRDLAQPVSFHAARGSGRSGAPRGDPTTFPPVHPRRVSHSPVAREPIAVNTGRTRAPDDTRRQDALDLDKLVGRDVTAQLAGVPVPSEEETRELSVLFNEALVRNFRKPEERSFYRLFKTMDLDGSHRISFAELEALVRGPLALSRRQLSTRRLSSLWKLLDNDSSGFVDAGELSRFCRIGKVETLTPAQLAKVRMLAAKEREAEQLKAEAAERQAKDVIKKQQQVERASKEEVRALGDEMSRALKREMPHGITNAYAMFKHLDLDGSGQIDFREFGRMVRHELKISKSKLSESKLLSLWRAIDENENGFICAGELGRFMRPSEKSDASVESEVHQKRREAHMLNTLKREESYARAAARASNTSAKAMEAEAARLESLLALASGSLAVAPTPKKKAGLLAGSTSLPALPPISGASASGSYDEGGAGTRSADASPSRTQAIRMLSQEVRQGGAYRVSANGRPKQTFLKEEFLQEQARGKGGKGPAASNIAVLD
jgi:Ca2+-binding EF-hand superfamily protein